MNALERRIIEISYRNKLTHVSSCLNTVNVLNDIYERRMIGEPVILGNGHASLAHYVVLEKFHMCDAQEMIERHGVHAGRDMERGVWCSNGALGQAETIAVGFALANRDRGVWLVTSDGACAEGAVWEAFNLASKLSLMNLRVSVIANGFGAYGSISIPRLINQLSETLTPVNFKVHLPVMPFEWLKGLDGHYLTLTELQYMEVMAS